jgi:hypothetical protein
LIRNTGRVPAYQKDAKIRVFRDFCLSLLPTIGERFGEWFEALLAKRVGRSKKGDRDPLAREVGGSKKENQLNRFSFSFAPPSHASPGCC